MKQKVNYKQTNSKKWLGNIVIMSGLLSPLAMAGNPSMTVTNADFLASNPKKAELGKLLFFDKILSGNNNTSCATCHHPLAATGDGLSLGVGEGGKGLGIMRDTGTGNDAVHERVPRNAPHLFNLGATQFVTMFHDGRLQKNDAHPTGFDTPAGDSFLLGIDHALAAQAAFPVTSTTEMAGQAGENDVANAAVAGNLVEVWRLLTERVMAIPEYQDLFKAAYPDLDVPQEVTYTQIANAIGAYEALAGRADKSPFDRFRRGEGAAMSGRALAGMALFNTKAKCATCHSGKFQTDHKFYALGIPQIGPGKGDGLNGHDDFGRERVTHDANDRYKFRTPTLRNVAVTGPWGHDGAYNTLDVVIRHHLNPVNSLNNYNTAQAVLPSRSDLDAKDFEVYNDADSRIDLAKAIEIKPVKLSDKEIALLTDFLNALTDPASLDLRATAPKKVPSGLPLAD